MGSPSPAWSRRQGLVGLKSRARSPVRARATAPVSGDHSTAPPHPLLALNGPDPRSKARLNHRLSGRLSKSVWPLPVKPLQMPRSPPFPSVVTPNPQGEGNQVRAWGRRRRCMIRAGPALSWVSGGAAVGRSRRPRGPETAAGVPADPRPFPTGVRGRVLSHCRNGRACDRRFDSSACSGDAARRPNVWGWERAGSGREGVRGAVYFSQETRNRKTPSAPLGATQTQKTSLVPGVSSSNRTSGISDLSGEGCYEFVFPWV